MTGLYAIGVFCQDLLAHEQPTLRSAAASAFTDFCKKAQIFNVS